MVQTNTEDVKTESVKKEAVKTQAAKSAAVSTTAVDVLDKSKAAGAAGQVATAGTQGLSQSIATTDVKVNAPQAIADISDMVGLMENGDFKLALPLVAGTKLGPLKVRKDTRAAITFKVEDGKIDFANTRIFFEKEDGSQTDLDGPLFIDPKSIYINEKGHIIADIKCLPNINITKFVIGEKKVPNTIEGMAKLINKMTGGNDQISLSKTSFDINKPVVPQELASSLASGKSEKPAGSVAAPVVTAKEEPAATEHDVEVAHDESVAEDKPEVSAPVISKSAPHSTQGGMAAAAKVKVSDDNGSASVKGAAKEEPAEAVADKPAHYSIKDLSNDPLAALMSAIQMDKVEVGFKGSLKAGPVSFGKDISFNVEPGSDVTIHGTPTDMVASMNMPIKGMNLGADDTKVRCGSGTVSLDLHLTREADRETALDFSTPMDVSVDIKAMNLTDFHAEAASASGEQNILEFAKFDLASTGNSLVSMQTNAAGESSMAISIPKTELNGLSGQLQLVGTDGQPSTLKLGNRVDGDRGDMSVSASLEMNSATGLFKLDGDIQQMSASIDRLSMVDANGFNMVLSGASILGSGTL